MLDFVKVEGTHRPLANDNKAPRWTMLAYIPDASPESIEMGKMIGAKWKHHFDSVRVRVLRREEYYI